MTILNKNKRTSEDYTFVINAEEFFEENPTIYVYQNNAWSELSSGNDFDAKYEIIREKILENNELIPLDVEANFNSLAEQHQNNAEEIYIGVKTSDQNGFPDIENDSSFIVLISDNLKICALIKLSSLESIKIVDEFDYIPEDKEYLSGKQIYNMMHTGSGDNPRIVVVTDWEENPSNNKVASEKLVKDTIDSLIGDIIDYIEE